MLGHDAEVDTFIAASRTALHHQRRRRNALLGGAAVVVTLLALVASAQASYRQLLLAKSYEEQGRQLLVHDQPQEALPYLQAAREHGDQDSSLLIMLATAARGQAGFPSHGQPIASVAFSGDARVFTASLRGDLDTWNATTGKLVGSLAFDFGCLAAARSVIGSSGAHMLLLLADERVRMCDAAHQQLFPAFKPAHRPERAWFSADTSRVVLESAHGDWEIWDAVTATSIRALPRPADDERSQVIAFSADGTRVAIKRWPGKDVQVWNVNDRANDPSSIGIPHAITSAAFSFDDQYLAIASLDGRLRISDLSIGKMIMDHPAHAGTVFTVAFNHTGSAIVTTSVDHTARVWSTRTGDPITPPLPHAVAVDLAIFSTDDKHVATVSGKTLRLWNARTGEPITDPRTHRDIHLVGVSSPTDPVGSSKGEGESESEASADDQHRGVQYAVLSPDVSLVLVRDVRGQLGVWETEHGTRTAELLGLPADHRVQGAAFNAEGTRVVVVSEGEARVWDVTTGGDPVSIWRPTARLSAAVFAANGVDLIGVTEARALVQEHPSTPVFPPGTWAVFSLDGKHVAIEDAKAVQVWELAKLDLGGITLEGQRRLPRSLSFTDDGNRVVTTASGTQDKSVRIRDLYEAKVRPPIEQQEPLKFAVFSHRGARVLTAGQDNSVRVWDATTGKPITRLLAHHFLLLTAMFNLEGTCVVTVTRDGVVHRWNISPVP